MLCAACSAAGRSAAPASTSTAGSPPRSTPATSPTTCGAARGRAGAGSFSAITPPSFQAVSAGRISVAIWPGCSIAACTAAAASAPTVAALVAVRTQAETPRAQPSVSAVSGASSGR